MGHQYKFFLFCVISVYLLDLATRTVALSNPDCGILSNENKIPWNVGVYLEQANGNIELVCLGTILKDNVVITASQCVCDTLSKNIRHENIYVSRKIEKFLLKKSEAIRVKADNIFKPKEYQGFLINPIGDVAVLKLGSSRGSLGSPVCIDWPDLTRLLQIDTAGILSVWDARIKNTDALLFDYDSCQSSATENFVTILSADKSCFKIAGSNLEQQSTGSGIFYQNPKNGRWYLEGVVSGSEVVQGGVLLAATNIRRYLTWLSGVCAT